MRQHVAGVRRRIAAMRAAGAWRVAFVLGLAAPFAQACDDATSTPREIAVAPDREYDLALTGAGTRVFVEEIGADVEYRWSAQAAYAAIDTPPSRLGFAVLDRASGVLTLRLKAGQGEGRVRLASCVEPAADAFFTGLAQWQSRYLGRGAEKAAAGTPLLRALAPFAHDREQRAWFANAYANALLAEGRTTEAIVAFREASVSWQVAERPERAAIATMSAGEEASRADRYDEAQSLLEQARDALKRAQVDYYALRSAAALCTVLSRRARYREAIPCDESIAQRMEARGEYAETVTRRASAANLHLRFDEYAKARAQLDAAIPHLDAATDISRARHDIASGNYALQTGDLPGAAQAYARAITRLGPKGLPAEQANLELKLAWLAGIAGAPIEHRRLLTRAAARLTPRDAGARLARLWVELAGIDVDLREPAAALARLAPARAICDAFDRAICADAVAIVEAQAHLDLHNDAQARALIAALPSGASPQYGYIVPLLAARVDVADGRAERARKNLSALDVRKLDSNQRALRTRLTAAAQHALGDHDGAIKTLADGLAAQAREAAAWPSATLRISARRHLATLQAAIFETLAGDAGTTLDAATFARVVTAIDAASVHALFRTPARNTLPPALRQVLSSAIVSLRAPDRSEVFLALAQSTGARSTVPTRKPRALPALAADLRVLLPLEGESTFVLLAWSGGVARVCLRMPQAQYQTLADDYDGALRGDDAPLDTLSAAAREWHEAIGRCHPDAPSARRWIVVSASGTRALPWSWIAAAADDGEPSVEIAFEFPTTADTPLATPVAVTLLDLDMPKADALPYAPLEREALEAALTKRRLPYRAIVGADAGADAVLAAMRDAPALHVIGHANPAVYGQLYQGLWFESGGKPALLTWPEIAANASRAQIVVLSACGTEAGEQARFGATSRLAEAFIAAGARRVVAASNALSDAAAPVWTGALHEALWKNGDVAEAARAARAALRESPHFGHPKYWAGIDVYVGAAERRGEEKTLTVAK